MLHMLHIRKKMLHSKIQTPSRRKAFAHENYEGVKRSAILPDRIPSLAKIAEQFLTGRPIDASLQRNIEYNLIERNPMLQKGLDLAELPAIARQVGMSIDAFNAEYELAKAKQLAQGTQSQVANPSVEEPAPPIE